MPTDVQVNNLIINKLSKAQYDNISQPSDTELYLIPDEIDSVPTANSTNTVTSGGVKLALDAKQDNMVMLTYGTSTWNDFITAYNKNAIVYCYVPTGDNGRLAFMAWRTPTMVEFQYYRSVSSHSATQQGDQVFIYQLTSADAWSTTTREAIMWTQAGNGLQRAVSGNNLTYSVKVPSNSGLTVDSNGVKVTIPLPSISTSDNGKVLSVVSGAAAWSSDIIPTESTVAGWGFTKNTGTLTTETDPIFSASAAAGITASDITNWNGKTSNTGTLTGVMFNGSSATVTNGVAAITATIPDNAVLIDIGGNPYNKTLASGTFNTINQAYQNGKIIMVKWSDGEYDYICNCVVAVENDSYTFFNDNNNVYFSIYSDNTTSSSFSGFIRNHATHKLTATNNTATATTGEITFVESLTGTNTATSGDLTITATRKKITVPSAVTESTVSGWGFTKNTGTYSKPSGGIPASDLASAVQTSLGKADTALQSYTETDPTVPSWAKASSKPTYTAAEVGALPDSTVIPAAPGTLKTNATTAQTASSGEAMSGTITLHKIAKTGTYSDLIGTPTIPTKVSDLTNDSNFTSNTGTVTGVKINGTTKTPTSGTVDLGTILTSETSLSKGTTTGSGNAVTDISVSGHQITLTKGSTFLTSETSLSKGTTSGSGNAVTDISVSGHQITLTKGSTFLTSETSLSKGSDSGSGNVVTDISVSNHQITLTKGSTVPVATSANAGKIPRITSGGAWEYVTPSAIYSGSGTPSNSTGNNGDVYLQTS